MQFYGAGDESQEFEPEPKGERPEPALQQCHNECVFST